MDFSKGVLNYKGGWFWASGNGWSGKDKIAFNFDSGSSDGKINKSHSDYLKINDRLIKLETLKMTLYGDSKVKFATFNTHQNFKGQKR